MVLTLVIVLVVVIFAIYIAGAGTDFLKDISASFAEKAAKQAEVKGEGTTVNEVFAKANLAKDVPGARICDLEIIFVGSVSDLATGPLAVQGGIEGVLGLQGARFIYFGDPPDSVFFPDIPSNKNIFEYTWMCQGTAAPITTTTTAPSTTTTTTTTTAPAPVPIVGEGSTGGGEICRTAARGIQVCTTLSILNLLSWNLNKNNLAALSFFDTVEPLALGFDLVGSNEVIRVNFIGQSINRPSFNLYTPDFPDEGIESSPFTKSDKLDEGANFPVTYRIPLILVDVTEDNYNIEFWYDDFSANNKAVGTHFDKAICKPSILKELQEQPGGIFGKKPLDELCDEFASLR